MNYALNLKKNKLKHLIHKIKKNYSRVDNKGYREDLQLWEKKRYKMWFISWYIYSIWTQGSLKVSKRLFRKHGKTAIYFKFVELPPIYIGRKELQERYQGNRWSVPLNLIYDPKLP